ncbi:MAG: hypothetical protein WCK16_04125 [Candidatus Moraniibacteriota bacterium]
MSEISRPEQFKIEKIKTAEVAINNALSKLKNVGLFSAAYLDKIKLVLFPEKEDSSVLVYKNGKIEEKKKEQSYSVDNFMNGLETDYVGLNSIDDYESFNMNDLNDHQFVETLFYKERPSYDEFVAHETGHNVFDLAYKQTEGDFEIFDFLDENGNKKGETTDCSEDYKNKIMEKIQKLFDKYDVKLSIAEFDLQRQKIAEIFALLTQREFSKRLGTFEKNHANVNMDKAKKVSSDLTEQVHELNVKTRRNISVDNFYSENHMLSFIIAPILEHEYPDFNERIKFFELEIEVLKNEIHS